MGVGILGNCIFPAIFFGLECNDQSSLQPAGILHQNLDLPNLVQNIIEWQFRNYDEKEGHAQGPLKEGLAVWETALNSAHSTGQGNVVQRSVR